MAVIKMMLNFHLHLLYLPVYGETERPQRASITVVGISIGQRCNTDEFINYKSTIMEFNIICCDYTAIFLVSGIGKIDEVGINRKLQTITAIKIYKQKIQTVPYISVCFSATCFLLNGIFIFIHSFSLQQYYLQPSEK